MQYKQQNIDGVRENCWSANSVEMTKYKVSYSVDKPSGRVQSQLGSCELQCLAHR